VWFVLPLSLCLSCPLESPYGPDLWSSLSCVTSVRFHRDGSLISCFQSSHYPSGSFSFSRSFSWLPSTTLHPGQLHFPSRRC
jgi:hypothetical protein